MELSEEAKRTARDIRDVASMAFNLADQLVHAGSSDDALGALIGLIGQGGTIRDAAADLYVNLTDNNAGGEG